MTQIHAIGAVNREGSERPPASTLETAVRRLLEAQDRWDDSANRERYQALRQARAEVDALLASPASSGMGVDERAGLQKAWDLVNAMIVHGEIQGNGCDETAQRNGLILATNAINAALAAAQYGDPT